MDIKPNETDDPDYPLDATVLNLLWRWRLEGALWTSDIADGCKAKTSDVRASLKRLEAKKKVVRVVVGNPTSWQLAP